MVILLTGATGFIGRHLTKALCQRGHKIVSAGRTAAPGTRYLRADFTRDLDASDWIPRLDGVDVVINAVGILRERGEQTFEAIHTRAPQALFHACVAAGVRRVIQISALGAQTRRTEYFASKHAADELLASLPLDWVIVQPSIVYGTAGASAGLFTMLASLPITPLPQGGSQQLQPIHVDDLAEAVVALCNDSTVTRARIALVGPRALSLRTMLTEIRRELGLRPALNVSIPKPVMRLAARLAELDPRALLDRASLTMLEMGNIADPATTTALLRRAPRDLSKFIAPERRDAARREALLRWLLPMLRSSIAAVWIWTGIVSLGLYPREQSLALLAQAGVPASARALFLYGAACLDLLFGVATLFMRRRRLLWLAQMLLIILYSVIISVKLPEFWLHPYGPMLKNLPMLAAIYVLYKLEAPPWNTSS